MKQIRCLLLLLCLSAPGVSSMAYADENAKESAGEYISDTWITTKVKKALVEDKLVKASEVNVETLKGVVLLAGLVSSEVAMNEAVHVASSVTGVTSVKNNMRIK